MRIGYVTTYDANDRGNWSGLGHSIMQSLIDQGIEVEALGPLITKRSNVARFKSRFYRQVLHQHYEYERNSRLCRNYARQIIEKLNRQAFDIILSPGSIPVSRLKCS